MSQNSSSSDVKQSDFFDKLDVSFTVILIIAGVLTFPPAVFVYWRILTLKQFRNQYIMKLFVLNGASNLFIYLVNLVAVQFSNWPSMFGFYSWLRNTFLSVTLRFLQDFSISVMWQTTFFISVNRLCALRNQHLLSKYDYHFFLTACFFSLFASLIICFRLFFSNYSYVQVFTLNEGVFAYIPQIPKPNKWTSTPAMVYQLSLAAGTLIVNIFISIFLIQMRKEHSSKTKSRPEQGLLLSSFIALLMHVFNDALKMASKIFNDDMISYFLTLTISVSTTLPFWTMIVFAHSMRRAVLLGLVSDRTRSTVGGQSGRFRTTGTVNL